MNFVEDRHRKALALILELGYLCAFSGSTRKQAIALLTAHKAAHPDARGHLMGEALLYLCCDGNPEEAVAVVRQAKFDYTDSAEDPVTVAFWAFILMQARYNSEAEKVIEYLLDHSDDPGALQLAQSIREEMLSPS